MRQRTAPAIFKGLDHFTEALPIFVNRYRENFELPEHQHDFIEIAYVAEGSGFHYIEDQLIPIVRGDLFVLPLHTKHVFRPSSQQEKSPLVVYNCSFSPEIMSSIPWTDSPLMDAFLLSTHAHSAWFRLHDSAGDIGQLFDLLYHEYQHKLPGSTEMLFSALFQLIIRIQRHRVLPSPTVNTTKHKIQLALHYIQQHCHEHLTLNTLALQCNLSERHFYRLFKQATGQSFISYLQLLRMRKSCSLLETTALPIYEIAYQSGYSNIDYFYAVFKKFTGKLPGEYRKQWPTSSPLEATSHSSP
jgi:AraC family L-rhamnose operon transcriptional activator RhaR